tara:strand:- start:25 stop:627 length:603 start_codon:yes stop_codon:yes gene_type:complete
LKIIFIVLLVIIFPQEFKTSTFEVESVSLLDSLPANMPLSKKLLWGKNGLIRKFNLAPNSRVEEIKLRSKMLQLHQKLGLLNVGLMGLQMYLGSDMYKKQNRDNASAHRYLGYTSFSIYMTTAGLQLFAPPAFRYSKGYSSIKIHRYLSYIHFAGMILTPVSGYYTAEHPNDPKPYRMHRNIVTLTFTSYTLAFLTTLLP